MMYRVHWKTQGSSLIEGDTINEAFHNAGYGGGILRAVDYYEEVPQLPIEEKRPKVREKTRGVTSDNDIVNPDFVKEYVRQSPREIGEEFNLFYAGRYFRYQLIEITPYDMIFIRIS